MNTLDSSNEKLYVHCQNLYFKGECVLSKQHLMKLIIIVNSSSQGIPSLLYRLKVWARAMADICQKGISPPNSHESILVA